MTGRLIAYVHVDGVAYGPDDTVPAAVAKRIGSHAWEDPEAAAGDGDDLAPPTLLQEPPRSGRGSGVDAWRAYAEQEDVDVAPEASREDVIAALESAGVVQPEQPKE